MRITYSLRRAINLIAYYLNENTLDDKFINRICLELSMKRKDYERIMQMNKNKISKPIYSEKEMDELV